VAIPVEQRLRLLGDTERTPDACVTFLNQMNAEWPDADLFAQISCAESRLYMHDVLLRDTDQMSMAHGLEVRVPLLDHHLASYVVSLPDALKRSGHKALLAESLPRPLPAAVRNLPKRGFSLPFDTWMRGPLRPFCQRALEGLEAQGLFREGSVTDLWTRFLARSPSATWPRVWSLVALQSWLERQHVRVT